MGRAASARSTAIITCKSTRASNNLHLAMWGIELCVEHSKGMHNYREYH
jgi:hypothetical protein